MESPFSYPGPASDLDAMATNRLIPPDSAKYSGSAVTPLGDTVAEKARWIETVMINEVTFEPPKKPLNNSLPGDVMAVLSVRCSIDPNGGPSKNVGRRISANYYFNMTAMTERDESGHANMTRNSFGGVYALTKALGLPGEAARDVNRLVEEYRPQMLGVRLLAEIEQRYDEERDRYYDSIRSFASAE